MLVNVTFCVKESPNFICFSSFFSLSLNLVSCVGVVPYKQMSKNPLRGWGLLHAQRAASGKGVRVGERTEEGWEEESQGEAITVYIMLSGVRGCRRRARALALRRRYGETAAAPGPRASSWPRIDTAAAAENGVEAGLRWCFFFFV